ncbi:hypothetical protein M0805_004446 [Coniferiporia weirii]|nr:hypothetical protein M0805_004446 [Coniferiporia weirii]
MFTVADRNRSNEIHGLPNAGSKKRGPDDRSETVPCSSSSSNTMGSKVWKSNPTKIIQPSTGPRNTVTNPYDRFTSRDSFGQVNKRGRTANPSARQTITDSDHLSRASKRQKTGQNGYNEVTTSKYYGPSEVLRGSPPTSSGRSASRSIAQTFGRNPTESFHPAYATLATRQNAVTSLARKDTRDQVIDVDNLDLDGMNFGRTPSSDGPDEMNLFRMSISADAHSMPPYEPPLAGPSTSELLKGYGSGDEHPFRQRDSPPETLTSRNIAVDGESTSRIRERYGSEHGVSHGQLRAEALRSSPVEEIEDADDFPGSASAPSSMVRTPDRQNDPPCKKHKTPGGSEIEIGKVKVIARRFERTSKSAKPQNIDLKKIKTRMKGKGKQTTKASMTNSYLSTRATRHDQLATSLTKYETNCLALPLEVCVWGDQLFQLPGDAFEPEFWLLWNAPDQQLQLCKNPNSPMKKVMKKYSLERCDYKLTYCDTAEHEFAKILANSAPGIPGDLARVGLIFKFMSKHANTNGSAYANLFLQLKQQAHEVELLHISSVSACLEWAMRESKNCNSRPEKSRTGTSHSRSASTVSTVGELSAGGENRNPVRSRAPPGNHPASGALIPSRRSGRLSAATIKHQATPSTNLDEVVLVYPPFGPGAVNITNGDLRRLEPSEFLNDTLIELGLKFWLNDLRAQQPELAEHIHVFSSFFYKKLNHKVFAEGYRSLRKWTAKIDLFKKKYIIVPINENVHWYLAIICNPEHILDPPPPKAARRTSKRSSKTSPRKSVRLAHTDGIQYYEDASGASISHSGSLEPPADLAVAADEDSEAAVEQVIQSTSSCSIEDDAIPQQDQDRSSELLSDSEFSYPAKMNLDRHSEPEHNTEENDVSMELGHVEGGGPLRRSTDADVVPDSEDEANTTESEEIDQLYDDDDLSVPVEMHQNGPGTSSPFHSDVNNRSREVESTSPEKPERCPQGENDHTEELPRPLNASTVLLPQSPTSVLEEDDAFSADNEELLLEEEGASANFVGHARTRKERSQVPLSLTIDDTGLESRKLSPAVPPISFYNARSRELPKTCDSRSRPRIETTTEGHHDVDDDERDIIVDSEPEVTDRPRTWIFSLDSLGSRHPGALNKLNQYLRAEAKDKKDNDNPSDAFTKTALVPAQPNFCDCGLYLLHFAKTFMSDPEKYKSVVCSTKKSAAKERDALWLGDKVVTMREDLKARILEESETWKKLKAERELEGKDAGEGVGPTIAVDSSDDEIEVSEVRQAKELSSPLNKPSRKAATSSVPRETRASRLRG